MNNMLANITAWAHDFQLANECGQPNDYPDAAGSGVNALLATVVSVSVSQRR